MIKGVRVMRDAKDTEYTKNTENTEDTEDTQETEDTENEKALTNGRNFMRRGGKGADLESGNIRSLMLRLALPTVVAQMVNMLYNIVDRVYIGHMPGSGADALTGVGLCFPLITLVTAFASLMCAGGAPRAAISMGQKDDRYAERIMGNCFAALTAQSPTIYRKWLGFFVYHCSFGYCSFQSFRSLVMMSMTSLEYGSCIAEASAFCTASSISVIS